MKNYLKTLAKIFLVLLAYFISQALIMTLFAAVGGAGAEGDIQSAMSGFLAQKASLISLLHNLLVIAVILAFYFKKQSIRDIIAIAPLPGKEYMWCALCAVASSIAVSLLLTLLPIPDYIMSSYNDSVAASSGGTFASTSSPRRCLPNSRGTAFPGLNIRNSEEGAQMARRHTCILRDIRPHARPASVGDIRFSDGRSPDADIR